MTPEGLSEVSDEELLRSHACAWHPGNVPRPIRDWSLAELDDAAALCDRILDELRRRGLLTDEPSTEDPGSPPPALFSMKKPFRRI